MLIESTCPNEQPVIQLLRRAVSAVAADDVDVETGFFEKAPFFRHHDANGTALRRPGHVAGHLVLRRRMLRADQNSNGRQHGSTQSSASIQQLDSICKRCMQSLRESMVRFGARAVVLLAITVIVGSRRAFEIQTEFPVIEVRKIGHATFETPDLEKAIAYYTLVNGLTLAGKDKGRAFLASKTGLLTVQLEQGQQARCTRLSFELAPDADFTAIRKQLFDEGIACEERRESSLGIPKLLSFSDPKGTVIELYSEWSYVGAQRDCVGIGPLKLGHVAFFVPDPNSIAQFYQRVLGFRVSDWLEDFFVFLRCNPDHHSINFLRGDRVRMHHIAFELRDVAHIANACDLLAASKIPLVWGPLRFGPGHNIAAFHRDHDGQLVEFYTELDQMKDETLGYFDPRPWHRDKPQRPKRWRLQDDPTWGPPPPADFM